MILYILNITYRHSASKLCFRIFLNENSYLIFIRNDIFDSKTHWILFNVSIFANPEPSREIAFVVHRNFVRERLLNILADAIKAIIPATMLYQRIKKFPITM